MHCLNARAPASHHQHAHGVEICIIMPPMLHTLSQRSRQMQAAAPLSPPAPAASLFPLQLAGMLYAHPPAIQPCCLIHFCRSPALDPSTWTILFREPSLCTCLCACACVHTRNLPPRNASNSISSAGNTRMAAVHSDVQVRSLALLEDLLRGCRRQRFVRRCGCCASGGFRRSNSRCDFKGCECRCIQCGIICNCSQRSGCCCRCPCCISKFNRVRCKLCSLVRPFYCANVRNSCGSWRC